MVTNDCMNEADDKNANCHYIIINSWGLLPVKHITNKLFLHSSFHLHWSCKDTFESIFYVITQ